MAKIQKQAGSPVELYIAGFPEEMQKQLSILRAIIRKAAPKAEEVISYAMPGYRMNLMLVWFAGFKNHIGFYPASNAIVVFKEELKKYKTSKGAIQFPIDQKIPSGLVTNIVKYRIKEVAEHIKSKSVYRKQNGNEQNIIQRKEKARR